MKEPDFKDLIDYRLGEAHEALRDAELLLDARRYRAAANRLYYAAFYCAIAVLLSRHLEYSKHSAVIGFFDREFIRTGILPREYSRTLHRAFSERQQDDYMPFVEVIPDELAQLLADVRTMLAGVSEYIKKNA